MERAPLRLACVSGPVDIDGVARPVDSGSRAGAAARIHTAYRATVRRRRTAALCPAPVYGPRSEEHTSELQSLMRISYAVFCLKKKNTHRLLITHTTTHHTHTSNN